MEEADKDWMIRMDEYFFWYRLTQVDPDKGP